MVETLSTTRESVRAGEDLCGSPGAGGCDALVHREVSAGQEVLLAPRTTRYSTWRSPTFQVTDLRRRRLPDEDTVRMLVYAADRLGHLEDSASELRKATKTLAPLADQASEWQRAARATHEAADAMLEAKHAR
ncbi:hypothetical protein ACFZBU_27210 [Embleya sp. NPDC008237]|uniref:hypothetical protein n=1 Tax=Embleya sp. NPDC008237 TaxID=3363978 RepID=UPI0036EA521C